MISAFTHRITDLVEFRTRKLHAYEPLKQFSQRDACRSTWTGCGITTLSSSCFEPTFTRSSMLIRQALVLNMLFVTAVLYCPCYTYALHSLKLSGTGPFCLLM